MKLRLRFGCAVAALLVAAAACPSPAPPERPAADGGAAHDGGQPADGGMAADGGVAADGGTAADGGVAADGGTPDGGGGNDFEVEVGTGDLDFVPLAPDERVPIVCGLQGMQHIWVGVRARNVPSSPLQVTVTIIPIEAPQVFACGLRIEDATLRQRDGWGEVAGILCVVADPERVREQPALLRGEVVAPDGRRGSAEIRIVPFGPEQTCTLGG